MLYSMYVKWAPDVYDFCESKFSDCANFRQNRESLVIDKSINLLWNKLSCNKLHENMRNSLIFRVKGVQVSEYFLEKL